jgi:hypothetical protein
MVYRPHVVCGAAGAAAGRRARGLMPDARRQSQIRAWPSSAAICPTPMLIVGLFTIIAQHEREIVSKQTKDALKAKKDRGAVLGTPANMTPTAIAKRLEHSAGECSYEST